MRKQVIGSFTIIFLLLLAGCVGTENSTPPKSEYDIATYVWPAYQPEPRWKELGIFNDGKGEWQNVYEAKPKRKGHYQPLEPLWGYVMDDAPKSMDKRYGYGYLNAIAHVFGREEQK